MGTHLIPREIDGDARILLIFTPKGFIGVLIGLVIGFIFQQLIASTGAVAASYVVMGIFGAIGFVIGQMKIPESRAFDLFRKTGGEYIRSVIVNYFRFKKVRKYYIYDYEAAKAKEKTKEK